MLKPKIAVLLGCVLAVAALAAHGEGPVNETLDYLPDRETANDKDLLDVHMPETADGVPVLVFFHGGGLTFGEKSYGDVLARRLLPLGIGVISANYRLSPGVQHPAHVEDAAAAFAWAVRHVAEYGGDPQRVYVSGHSAGAYLAALLALDPVYLDRLGIPPNRIAGAILISPFLYVEETAKERPKSIWGDNPADWLAASVSPHIGPGKPPLLILYADGDDAWRKDQNQRFAAAMLQAGNPGLRIRELPDRDHASLLTRVDDADDVVGEEIRAFVAR